MKANRLIVLCSSFGNNASRASSPTAYLITVSSSATSRCLSLAFLSHRIQLVVVIGKTGKNIHKDKALEHVVSSVMFLFRVYRGTPLSIIARPLTMDFLGPDMPNTLLLMTGPFLGRSLM